MFRIFQARASHTSNDLYIHHHLGLGDMIHCNGMVRHLLSQLEPDQNVCVFCKNRNLAMTAWMYRDEPRIKLIAIDETKKERHEVGKILYRDRVKHFLSVGHKALRQLEPAHPSLFFDQLFYLQVGIPYEYRFSKCYWEREREEEERVFEKLAPAGAYAFVHDDPSRGFVIDTSNIDLPIVRNDITESIFHLGQLLENATEVHCMESSIRCMIESLDMSRVDLYLHNFRYSNRSLGTATCQPWREIHRPVAA